MASTSKKRSDKKPQTIDTTHSDDPKLKPDLKTPEKTKPLEAYYQTTPIKTDEESTEGYLVHLTSPNDQSRFNFMIQGKRKCLNFVCFEPEKKKALTDLLGSPVKVKNTKTSKRSTDLQFTRNSEITPGGKLDFEIIDMENLTIASLTKLAVECVVTIKAKVQTRSRELETSSGLPFQILSVSDQTDKIKVMLWGATFVNKVLEGQTYLFNNVRIKTDKRYGGIQLGTTPTDNTTITLCEDLSDAVDGSVVLAQDDSITLTGSILMVSKSMVEYVTCKKCRKKIDGDVTGDMVFCTTCDGDILKKKCKMMRVSKIDFEESETEKMHHLSMFSNVMDKLLSIDCSTIAQADLRLKLLQLPKLKITVSKNVVSTAEQC